MSSAKVRVRVVAAFTIMLFLGLMLNFLRSL
jgi:hypothetical protein